MKRNKGRLLLEYAAFRCLIAGIWILPVRLQRVLAWSLATLMCRVLPRRLTRYDIAFDNIRQSFGEEFSDGKIDQTIFGMWQHLLRMVCEMVQFPRKVSCNNIYDVVQFRNKDQVIKALCSGRPVIMLSGHFGNWEMSIATFGMFGFPMGVVARTLDNPYLDDWFRRFRESTGHVMIDKKGGGTEMQDRLVNNQHLALLADQDAGRRGVFVDFFGRPGSTYKSIAILALRYDALVCVGYSIRLPDNSHSSKWVKYELGCEAILDAREYSSKEAVREMTQDYTTALERAVRRAPEQYFWVHRRWKNRPPEVTAAKSNDESQRRAG
jgi:Kdo2-lipid IVA lauroyltransferase/acyltransferase